MGAEYLFIFPEYVVSAGGLFYDPAPVAGALDDFFGFTLGIDLFIKRFSVDIAYQYRVGNHVGEYWRHAAGFSDDARGHPV